MLNLLFALPNVFFYCLTGKLGQAYPQVGSGMQTMSLSLGTMLSALLLPAVGIGTLLGNGGTLVVAAALREADSL
jgi:hypothetical protein